MSLKILCLFQGYPRISQTYMSEELALVADTYDIVVARHGWPVPAEDHLANYLPYSVLDGFREIRRFARKVRPSVIHAHYATNVELCHRLARELDCTYTIRTHSFDTLNKPPEYFRQLAQYINDPHCLGILTLPYSYESFIAAGARPEKIVKTYPVVNVARFLDRRPNGSAVVAVSSMLPKKKIEDFIRLSSLCDFGRQFVLYGAEHDPGNEYSSMIHDLNRSLGSKVLCPRPVQPEDMPSAYKNAEWLVYPARREDNAVGWPLAVVEAQASGVGVCMLNLRPDLKELIGDAGYLFDDISEIVDVVRRPFPPEKREQGFELAKRCDIRRNIGLLTELWDSAPKAAASRTRLSLRRYLGFSAR